MDCEEILLSHTAFLLINLTLGKRVGTMPHKVYL